MPMVTVCSDTKGIADGQNHVADLQLIAVAQGDGRQSRGVNFQHRHIRRRIGADDLGGVFLVAVGGSNLDFDFVRAVHDVVGRQNVAVRRNHDAGPEAFLPACARLIVLWKLIAKELAEKRVVEKRIAVRTHMNDARGIDVHHARRGLFDDGGKADARSGVAIERRGFNLDIRPCFLSPRQSGKTGPPWPMHPL